MALAELDDDRLTPDARALCHVGFTVVFAPDVVHFEWLGGDALASPGELVLLYGCYPHRIERANGQSPLSVTIPLAEALTWQRRSSALDAVFRGELVRECAGAHGVAADEAAFARWQRELGNDAGDRRPAELEIQARVHRLLATQAAPSSARVHEPMGRAAAAAVASVAAYVTDHIAEPLPVEVLARHTGQSGRSIQSLARRAFGMPLAQYITRMRLAEAQRLLRTTDLPVLAVCHLAGFSSTVRMYDAFDRHLATTPARYRRGASISPSSGSGDGPDNDQRSASSDR